MLFCLCPFSFSLFASQRERKRTKKKEKRRTVFYVFTEALPPFSRVLFSAKAESFLARYCATHTLTYCRALFERSEFARLKRLSVAQNKKPQPNEVRMMRTLACFSFFLFYFSSSFCLANKRKKKSRTRLKTPHPVF